MLGASNHGEKEKHRGPSKTKNLSGFHVIKLEYVCELSVTNGIIWEMGPQQVHWEGYSSLAAILEGGS